MLKMYLQKGIAAAAAAVMLVCSVSLEAFADSSVPEMSLLYGRRQNVRVVLVHNIT